MYAKETTTPTAKTTKAAKAKPTKAKTPKAAACQGDEDRHNVAKGSSVMGR
jgi:hypothetical protein